MKKKSKFPENCPQCGHPQLDRSNPFGKLKCPNCFWLADVSDYAVKPGSSWRTLSQGIYLFSLVTFIIFIGVQLFLWQQFSVEVSWLMLKRVTAQATIDDWLDMGAICNSLEKFNCSVDSFSRVVDHQPSNPQALANLAVAYCRLNKWQQAQKYFEAYFSVGGDAFDIMFWYARSLTHLGEKRRGADWYYKVLTKKADFMEASTELVDQLMAMDHYEEALSFIAHITDGHPEKDMFWGKKVANLNAYMHGIEKKRDPRTKESLKIPSLNGSGFYLPMWMEERGQVDFILVDETQADVVFPRELVDVRLIKRVRKKKNWKIDDSVSEAIVPRLRVGPWWLTDVKVFLCEGCPIRGGKSLLNRLHMKELTRFGSDFLIFSQ